MSSKYAGCEAKLPHKDMPGHLKESVVSHMTLLARQNQELKARLSEKDNQTEELVKEHRRELDRLEQEKNQQFERLTTEMTRQRQELTTEMARMRQELQREAVERQDATSRSIEKLCHHVKIAPVQIVMTNYKQHKRNSDEWYSDGFYTHPHGYKMCLEVDANGSGYGLAKGTHVSCYIYLMRGEFDNHLKWPFRGAVTITLLNQREDKNHHTHTVPFTDQTKYAARVTSGERAGGCGIPQFIPHSQLGYNQATNCQYLVNSCLYFRVKVELQ